MFRVRHPLLNSEPGQSARPDLPSPYVRVPSSTELCALSVSALSSLCLTLSLFGAKTEKLSPAFSCPSALFKKQYFNNSFSINGFGTLLQNTGGVPTPFFSFLPLLTIHYSLFTNSFRIRISAKTAHNPFRIRSFKTQHLKPFRIRIYKKRGWGAPSANEMRREENRD
jgi:hypothetical protein